MNKLFSLLLCVCLLGLTLFAVACTQPDDPADATEATAGTGDPATADGETAAPATAPDTSSASDAVSETETDPETAPETEPETVGGETAFEPVIRFVVCSDVHISNASCVEAQRFAKLFQSAYAYSDSQTYNKLDAVIVVGDMTDLGSSDQLGVFLSVVDRESRDETQVIHVMGNHEYCGSGPTVYRKKTGTELNKHVVINGFHFIGISPGEAGQTYESSVAWLTDALAEANADDSAKPIFTFRHHHLQNTVYVSRSWYTASSAALKRVMGNYPQIIDFSGDSHGPMNNPMSIMQDKFTTLGTGTLSYFEMETGMTDGTLPNGKENAAQYYIVEVDAANCVRIQPYNILTDSFFRTPSNTDGADEQLIYEIKTPSDPASFTYTADRKKTAAKPYFGTDAQVAVSDIESNWAVITVPQAFDDSCIYSYTLTISADGKTLHTFKYFSEYYFEPIPATVSYTVTGLKADTVYEVSVAPVNVWGIAGEPIKTTFRTETRPEIEYVPAHSVTYKWTFTDFESMEALSASSGTPAYGGQVTGDVFAGQWNGNEVRSDTVVKLAPGKGVNGSQALSVTKTGTADNRGWYLFANNGNQFATAYNEPTYLRIWVDFTGVDFRKACFGVLDGNGNLYSTDDIDGQTDQAFYYMAEGSTEWVAYTHGNDGCFGRAQNSSVDGFKGWLAFPTADFGGRKSFDHFSGTDVTGIYMYWDFADAGMCGTEFYIDEISLVPDYRVFEDYQPATNP